MCEVISSVLLENEQEVVTEHTETKMLYKKPCFFLLWQLNSINSNCVICISFTGNLQKRSFTQIILTGVSSLFCDISCCVRGESFGTFTLFIKNSPFSNSDVIMVGVEDHAMCFILIIEGFDLHQIHWK